MKKKLLMLMLITGLISSSMLSTGIVSAKVDKKGIENETKAEKIQIIDEEYTAL